MLPFSEATLKSVYSGILEGLLRNASPLMQSSIEEIIVASIDLFQAVQAELLPTPAKSHYTFNLRDLFKVYQGIISVPLEYVTKKEMLLRLWIHENERVYADRLVDEEDKMKFIQIVRRMLLKHFKEEEISNIVTTEVLLFGDFVGAENSTHRNYVEITDMQLIKKSVIAFMEDYNIVNTPNLRLVLFDYALDHLTKICRIVRQPLGHGLLLGLPGSGRESLTRLAAYMSDRSLFTVDVKQTYGINEWQEDMRKLLRQVGVEGKSVVFLIKDSQVTDEQFLEDVHNLLNNGESK